MSKRFKILKGALEYLRNGDTATDVTLPAGTPLRRFQEWNNKERAVTYTRRTESNPLALDDVSVFPFGIPHSTGDDYIVPISRRTATETSISALRAKANIVSSPSATANRVRGFVPAKCTVSVPNASLNDNSVTSKLTGLSYAKKGAESYTFPYGKSGTVTYEETVRAEIRGALTTSQNFILVFKSEKL